MTSLVSRLFARTSRVSEINSCGGYIASFASLVDRNVEASGALCIARDVENKALLPPRKLTQADSEIVISTIF